MLHSGSTNSRRKRSYLPAFKIRLIEIVRQFPQLYQSQHFHYKSRTTVAEAWLSIARIIGEEFGIETKTDALANELAYLWRNLRDQLKHYRRQARHRYIVDGSDPLEVLQKWEFFESIAFLNEELNIQERESFDSRGEIDPLCHRGENGDHLRKLTGRTKRHEGNQMENRDFESIDLDSLLKQTSIDLENEEEKIHPEISTTSNHIQHLDDDPSTPFQTDSLFSIDFDSEYKPPLLSKSLDSSQSIRSKRPRFDISPPESNIDLSTDPHRSDPAIVQLVHEKYASFSTQSASLAREFENELLRLILSFNDKASAIE